MSDTLTDPRVLVLGEVLEELRAEGCTNGTANRLHQLVRDGRLPKPLKDHSGRCLYSPAFVEKARLVLLELPSAKRPIAPEY